MGNESSRDEFDEVVETPFGFIARKGRFITAQNLLTEDEHAAFVAHIVEQGLPAIEADRERLRQEITGLLESLEPLEMLMQFAVPYLSSDPNTFKEWEIDRLPAHVEYLALQILSCEKTEPADWRPDDMASGLARLESLVKELFLVHHQHLAFTTALVEEESTALEREIRFRALSNSLLLRYPAYPVHEEATLHGLFDPFDQVLMDSAGFTVTHALEVTEAIGSFMQDALGQRQARAQTELESMRKQVKRARRKGSSAEPFIEALAQLRPSDAARRLQAVVISWVFFGSRHTFALDTDRLAPLCPTAAQGQIRAVLEAFTATAGSYDERYHALPAPTHPLQVHPLLRDGDAWLAPLPASLLYAIRPILEALLQTDQSLWERYTSHRGKYLELAARSLLQKTLGSSAQGWNQVEWQSPDGQSAGEIDALVACDSVALRVQCKAGRFSAPARRGGLKRLETEFRELIGDAAEQHNRLRDALETWSPAAVGMDAQSDALGRPLQFEIIVTLEELGTFAAEVQKLRKIASLSADDPVPWVVSLNDLRVIADMLSSAELVHYLSRRARLNRLQRVVATDELDWLGHYLTEGLYFDDLFAEDPEARLGLLSYTEQFDSWYFALEGLRTVPTRRPGQDYPRHFGRVLSDLQRTAPGGYMVACLAMLDWADDTRQEFDTSLEATLNRARSGGAASFTFVFLGQYVFTVYLRSGRRDDLRHRLRDYLREKLTDEANVMCIGVGMTDMRDSYLIVIEPPEHASGLDSVFLEPRVERTDAT